MKIRIICFLGLLLGSGLSLQAGKPVLQRFFVSNFDSKNSSFTSLPAGLPELRRGAFPFAGRSIVIDLFRPIVVDKVVIPLRKFAVNRPETRSEADRMQVYAGLSPDKLALSSGVKVTVTAGEINGVPSETVTITNLPEARYLLFYAPRTDKNYVFGIQDGKKEIQVWADAPPAVDPEIAALPEAGTMDSGWAKTALSLESCGFQDVNGEEAVLSVPYSGTGGGSQIGWPWTNRLVEFSLSELRELNRIVFDLRKMQMQFPEKTTGLEKCTVYQSEDGKNFRPVPVNVEHLLYRRGDEVYARVTLSGDFRGKYFRVYTAWTKKYYVFGTRRLDVALKVFPAGPALSGFELPLLQKKRELSFAFQLDGREGSRGTLLLQCPETANQTLWRQEITAAVLNRKKVFSCSLPANFPAGVHTLQLAVVIDGQTKSLMKAPVMYRPEALVLPPPEKNENWRCENLACGMESKQFCRAVSPGAELEYTIPETGEYALYLLMAGKKPVQFRCGEFSGEKCLEMWHPGDLTDVSAGLNYLCAGSFNAGDKLLLIAAGAGCSVGEAVLIPLSSVQKEALKTGKNIKPAVILHSDGYSDFFYREVTTAYLDGLIDSAKRGNAFAFDWCVGTTAVNYPSRISCNFGGQKNPDLSRIREGDRLAIARLQQLLAQCNPLQHLIGRAKREGVRLSITIRANPFYVPLNSILNSQYFIDRPHCLLRRQDGSTGYLQLSYAHEDTRKFFQALAGEVAACRPDAIVLDFLRHPPFFGYDEPLKAEYRRRYGSFDLKDVGTPQWQKICAEIMTEHIRSIRRIIDEIDPNIALELSCDWAKYYQHGVDLETLLKEGLLDVISPGIYEVGARKYFPLAPFRTMIAASARKVLLIPRVEATIYGGDPTIAEEKGLEVIRRRNVSENMFRALWLRFAADGADGLRPFNISGASLAAALADQASLRRFELFVMPLLDFRTKIQPFQK